MGRSFRSSQEGAKIASEAFKVKGWTQDHLAGRAGCSRATVNKFLGRGNIERRIFIEICVALELDWGEIAELETEEKQHHRDIRTTELVQDIRQKVHDDIQNRCGTMRVLDMEQSIGLDDLYTRVNILEKITGRQRLGIAELQGGYDVENFDPEKFDRFQLGQIWQERVPGVDAVAHHDKLMVLGKPGAGKTTFLKRLAVQCNSGEFQPSRVPIFISLKQFAEATSKPGLLAYIVRQFAECQVKDSQAAEALLAQGKGLVLLDGLDEVREIDRDRILKEIRRFSQIFRDCQFVMTCRIAAREYMFEQFVEVEIADFDEAQIAEFSRKWFQAKEDPIKAETFVEKLKENKPVLELATNPLLLTLLCLVFGESADFPANRSELYKEGLDLLLKKWDAKRNIERDRIYKNLSRKRKEGLLSQIAFTSFDRGEYFFKQKTVERQIADYIDNLPETSTDPEAQPLESEAILKSIEAQHGLLVERAKGIYSFSHLTFHEYFTAQKIVTSPATQALEALKGLAGHITEKRWWEVFLLAVGMLEPADDLLLLMKHQVDKLMVEDEKLQELLTWVDRKARSVEASYKPAAVRAFYLSRCLPRYRDGSHDLFLSRYLHRYLDRYLDPSISPDLFLHHCLNLDLDLYLSRSLCRCLNLDLDRSLELEHEPEHELEHKLEHELNQALQAFKEQLSSRDLGGGLNQALQALKNQLPTPKGDRETFKQWWKANGKAWAEQLRVLMIQHRDIGHDWQFSEAQKERLQQYYDANQFLLKCLNSDCYVTRGVREEIEATLLLPREGG